MSTVHERQQRDVYANLLGGEEALPTHLQRGSFDSSADQLAALQLQWSSQNRSSGGGSGGGGGTPAPPSSVNINQLSADLMSGANDWRDWAEGLLSGAVDSTQIMADAQRFTPQASAETQSFIDYAVSLVNDPESILRRSVDGDFDFTQFEQGVVAPLRRQAKQTEKEIFESFAGGDAYGKQGGSGAVSGGARVAASKFRSKFSEQIAGLRYQEYNRQFERGMAGMQILGQLGEFVDDRKYQQFGISAAMELAGTRAQGTSSLISSGLGLYGSLASSSLSAASSVYGSDISALNTRVQASTQASIAAAQNQLTRDITRMELNFAESEANRDQTNFDRLLDLGRTPTTTTQSASNSGGFGYIGSTPIEDFSFFN